MPVARFAVVGGPLDPDALTAAVVAAARHPVGAVDIFLGIVRGENLGRRVEWLEYEAYEPLAVKAFERIYAEARNLWPGATLGVHHRMGRLEVGTPSVAIVAATAHRSEAFAACRYAIERVKQIAPIWKHEHFEGGDTWIEGATADPEDEAAREEARRRACA